MQNHRLPSFTIMEVVIAMLLSAILITMTYTAYGIISKSFGNFTKRNSDMLLFVKLDELLRKDISNGDLITGNAAGITITTRQTEIKYFFNKDHILRKGGRIDTFKVSPIDVSLSFENKHMENSGTEEGIVDDLYLPVTYQNEKIILHYSKSYSSVNLFQFDQHAND